MSWFIFVGDMLVMLFMVGLVIWVFMVSSDKDIENAGKIPLQDEDYAAGVLLDKEQSTQAETDHAEKMIGTKKVGAAHG